MTSASRLASRAAVVLLAAGVGLASAATVHVRLTGSHEVPAVKTMARGSGMIEVAADGAVSGKITTHGIRATMAHIHQAAPGKNGPVIISLESGPNGTWLVPAGSKLSAEQLQAFLAGHLYINVHSKRHPSGEIRGQLKP
ncbi:MAG: CHRD domain-containing protein [Steroidobacteraceae bacterium]